MLICNWIFAHLGAFGILHTTVLRVAVSVITMKLGGILFTKTISMIIAMLFNKEERLDVFRLFPLFVADANN